MFHNSFAQEINAHTYLFFGYTCIVIVCINMQTNNLNCLHKKNILIYSCLIRRINNCKNV